MFTIYQKAPRGVSPEQIKNSNKPTDSSTKYLSIISPHCTDLQTTREKIIYLSNHKVKFRLAAMTFRFMAETELEKKQKFIEIRK